MIKRLFSSPITIIMALLALTTLTYLAMPIVLWTYHISQANRLLAEGLRWPEPRYVESMPQVNDRAMLHQAREHLAAAMRYRPRQNLAYRLAGQIALAQGQPEQAVAVLEQGRALAPHNALLAWDTGVLYAQMPLLSSDYETAMLKVWHDSGVTTEALISQAEYARREKRYDVALLWCERAILLDPYNSQVWHKMGVVYTNMQNYAQALSAYERAAALLPDDRDAWYTLGLAYLRVQQPEQALVAYEQGLTATTGRIGLSNLYYQIGNLKLTASQPRDLAAAWIAYEQALRLNDYIGGINQRSETYRQRGGLLLRQERYPEALQQFQAALTLHPENYWAHLALAQTFWRLDHHQEALRLLNKAIVLRPDVKSAYSLLGQLYAESGDRAAARAMYQKVLELDPQDNTARQALDALNQLP